MSRSLIIFVAAAIAVSGQTADLDRVHKLYDRTEYNAALKLLLTLPDSSANAAVQMWIGKNYFMLGEFKKASDCFERAVLAEPNKSENYHWLGKAYGRRAETANPFSAPLYASKARQNFEKAISLDRHNSEAIDDLFEYYVEAPGFLGGGVDKAANLAQLIQANDPAEGHWALAVIAEHQRQYSAAEQHLRRAVEMAPRQVGRIIDLAKFLSKQGRDQESEAVFAQAEKIAPDAPKLLFARASTYIRARKNLETAKLLLERFLKAPLTPEDPSREEAQRLLRIASGA